MESGEHLPALMRDFHDQKDLFKSIHELVDFGGHDEVTWVAGHCYVIDIFLWFMAKRGYTLQRSRKRLPFRDIGADIEGATKHRRDASTAVIYRAMIADYTNAGEGNG